jgi:hypothetical protein
VERDWRRLHNEELRNLNASQNIRWVGYVARTGEMRNVHKMLVGKRERKRRSGRRWEDDIRLDLREY